MGFPASSEDKYLNGRNIIESDDAYKVIGLTEPIDLNAFVEWKKGIELKESTQTGCMTSNSTMPESDGHIDAGSIIRMVRDFNVANSTPMQCMMFIAQLQGKLND